MTASPPTGRPDASGVDPTRPAPSLLTFVTAVDDDVETGLCIDGVCAVDPPR
ncbi:hypothetical protein [Serinibacter arcticus]|uniref:Uncharacterized protein n=1 Tax=Serinibacter arcticus TaxID=1655435 RepID=A0A4Z1E5H8_9MICO|nr:hypothetical protein [Serinibacter arcticus]TGO05693.1 hypothetical protein SERN_1697 [Serinibacter arcticus]